MLKHKQTSGIAYQIIAQNESQAILAFMYLVLTGCEIQRTDPPQYNQNFVIDGEKIIWYTKSSGFRFAQ